MRRCRLVVLLQDNEYHATLSFSATTTLSDFQKTAWVELNRILPSQFPETVTSDLVFTERGSFTSSLFCESTQTLASIFPLAADFSIVSPPSPSLPRSTSNLAPPSPSAAPLIVHLSSSSSSSPSSSSPSSSSPSSSQPTLSPAFSFTFPPSPREGKTDEVSPRPRFGFSRSTLHSEPSTALLLPHPEEPEHEPNAPRSRLDRLADTGSLVGNLAPTTRRRTTLASIGSFEGLELLVTTASQKRCSGDCRGYAGQCSLRGERELALFCGTWNLANKVISEEDVQAWLPKKANDQDIYAIGVQEARGSENLPALMKQILPNHELLTESSGGGPAMKAFPWMTMIGLFVFVRSAVRQHITDVHMGAAWQKDWGPTNPGNRLGNKGAVSTSFKVNGHRVCFVCCHLTAHQDLMLHRNKDVEELMGTLHTDQPDMDLCSSADYLFWMGDLNYRVDFMDFLQKETPRKPELGYFNHMVSMIPEDIPVLLEKDQLLKMQRAKKVFYGFNEQKIEFRPTFKCKIQEGMLEYSPARLPAWCDRILWHSGPNKPVRPPCAYQSLENLTLSDHKPVFGLFYLPVFEGGSPHQSQLGECTLNIEHIECHGIHNEGVRTALRFMGEILEKGTNFEMQHVLEEKCTTPFQAGINPEWRRDLPCIRLGWNNLRRLKQEHLTVKIITETGATIGYARIPLAVPEAGSTKCRTSFECPISRRGLPAGVITGSMKLKVGDGTVGIKIAVVGGPKAGKHAIMGIATRQLPNAKGEIHHGFEAFGTKYSLTFLSSPNAIAQADVVLHVASLQDKTKDFIAKLDQARQRFGAKPVVVAGSQSDRREISQLDAEAYMRKTKTRYVECSVVTTKREENIRRVLEEVVWAFRLGSMEKQQIARAVRFSVESLGANLHKFFSNLATKSETKQVVFFHIDSMDNFL